MVGIHTRGGKVKLVGHDRAGIGIHRLRWARKYVVRSEPVSDMSEFYSLPGRWVGGSALCRAIEALQAAIQEAEAAGLEEDEFDSAKATLAPGASTAHDRERQVVAPRRSRGTYTALDVDGMAANHRYKKMIKQTAQRDILEMHSSDKTSLFFTIGNRSKNEWAEDLLALHAVAYAISRELSGRLRAEIDGDELVWTYVRVDSKKTTDFLQALGRLLNLRNPLGDYAFQRRLQDKGRLANWDIGAELPDNSSYLSVILNGRYHYVYKDVEKDPSWALSALLFRDCRGAAAIRPLFWPYGLTRGVLSS